MNKCKIEKFGLVPRVSYAVLIIIMVISFNLLIVQTTLGIADKCKQYENLMIENLIEESHPDEETHFEGFIFYKERSWDSNTKREISSLILLYKIFSLVITGPPPK